MKNILWAVALMIAMCGVAFGQSATTGQIAGTVRDATGAVIPGAKVVAISPTGQQHDATADGRGYYRFPNLDPGNYTVTVSSATFAPYTAENVVVSLTESTDVSPQLAPAGSKATVTVTSEAELLETTDATTGRVVNAQAVHDLPLPTRNFQQLLALSPGTNSSLTVNTELGRGDIDLNVNGEQATANNVIIDGIYANSIGTGSTPNLAVPSPDAVEEFIVQTSLYDATTGRNTGGNVALITRSGTNQFHGSAFGFFRDTALNANDYLFKREGLDRGTLNRNVFGGTIGGPIKKDKAFLFLSYQGQREHNADCLSSCIFTNYIPAGLTSDRSTAALAALATTYGATYLNPTSLALLQAQLPNGNFAIPSAANLAPNADGTVTTLSRETSIFRDDQFDINLDDNVTAKDHVSAKFFSENSPEFQADFSFLGSNAYQVPGFGGNIIFRNRLLSVGYTHTFTPAFLNDARVGFSRIRGRSLPVEPFTNAQFGIANPLAATFPGLSTIAVAGEFTLGPTSLSDEKSVTETFQYSDYLTYTHGRHTLRFGGDIFRNHTDALFNAFSRGEILTDGVTAATNFSQFLDGGLNLVGGVPTDPVIGLLGNGINTRYLRTIDGDMFVQEDFRMSDTLTLNAGIRIQRYGGISETQGRLVNFNPATFLANNSVPCTIAASCATPGNGFEMLQKGQTLNPTVWNGAPRVGFSWKPDMVKNTVVRGGYGMYYDRFSTRIANLQFFNYPYNVIGIGLGAINAPFPNLAGLTFPLPAVVPSPIPEYYYGFPLTGIAQTPISGYYVAPNFTAPYDQQYNLSVQVEPVHDWLLEVGYVGSKGTKLINVYTVNQIGSPNYGLFTASGFSSNKAFNGLEESVNNGTSHYDSLQVSLTKRMDKHLQFLASYTYSHSLDTGSGSPENELAALPGDQQNFNSQYGSSDFDRTHRFVVSGLFDFGQVYKGGSKVLAEGANGWQASSIIVFQTGNPFSVICSAGSTINSRANYVGGSYKSPVTGAGKLEEYFNLAAFSCPLSAEAPFGVPGPYVDLPPFGSSSRNIIRGPGQSNIDFSLFKRFDFYENTQLEFRSEFFNIGNWANFGLPNNNLLGASPGVIGTPGSGPRVIQFALKVKF